MKAVMSINVEGLLPLKRQMQLLAMPRALRRRLLNKVAKKLIKSSKARVKQQVDLNGKPYAKHSKGRKRKMLARLARQLKVTQLTGTHAQIGFHNPVVSKIAAAQQVGKTQTVTAKSFERSSTSPTHYDKPATRKQAKALREVGYVVGKSKGKKGKKPSLKWVTQNLTVGQAGVIIKKLRIDAGETIKKSWVTKLPARSFLGATQLEIARYIESIFTQMKQEVTHVAR